MKNLYFPEEDVRNDDLFFICYMIERIARRVHQRNRCVVNMIGKKNMYHLISVAGVLHAQNQSVIFCGQFNTYLSVPCPAPTFALV